MAIFKKPAIKEQNRKKREIPQGLFQKCPGCSEVVPEIELAQNQRVCPRCDYHFAQSARERLENLLDPETFVEMDADLKSVDILRFQGMVSYKDRLKKYQESTGLLDAVISGYGILDGYKVAIAVMDFGFLAATMGSVVGERITRTIEYGTAEHSPVIIVAASGGARMYVIGFAGPRVIKETTHQDLPQRFQTAEFLEEHGLIDMIVHRKKMREQLSQLLSYFAVAP